MWDGNVRICMNPLMDNLNGYPKIIGICDTQIKNGTFLLYNWTEKEEWIIPETSFTTTRNKNDLPRAIYKKNQFIGLNSPSISDEWTDDQLKDSIDQLKDEIEYWIIKKPFPLSNSFDVNTKFFKSTERKMYYTTESNLPRSIDHWSASFGFSFIDSNLEFFERRTMLIEGDQIKPLITEDGVALFGDDHVYRVNLNNYTVSKCKVKNRMKLPRPIIVLLSQNNSDSHQVQLVTEEYTKNYKFYYDKTRAENEVYGHEKI